MGENLAAVPEMRAGQEVVLPVEAPIKKTGHLQILYGNLAPEGSVAKITGGEGLRWYWCTAVDFVLVACAGCGLALGCGHMVSCETGLVPPRGRRGGQCGRHSACD